MAARVGYDPFFAWARKTIVASMAPASLRGFVAKVDLVDEQGMDHGARTLQASGECRELLDVVALTIAIAIDPQSLVRPMAVEPTPPQTTTVVEAPQPPTAKTPAPLPREPEEERSQSRVPTFEVAAGAVASAGVAPLMAAGIALGGAVRSARLSVEVEGRVDVPVSVPATGGGSLLSWLGTAAVVPCVLLSPTFLCAVGQLGSMQVSSENVTPRRAESVLWVAVGGRFGVELPLHEEAALRVRTDFVGDVRPPTFRLNGMDQWTAPAVAASLSLDIVVHFQ